MAEVNIKELLKDIPSLLSASCDVKDSMDKALGEIDKILGMPCSAIYYFSDEGAYIKAAACDKVFPEFIYDTEILSGLSGSDFAELPADLLLSEDKKNKFFVVPLKIDETVFGVIAVAAEKALAPVQIDVLNIISSVISYVIKDNELSSVFKSQLSEMQTSIVDKEEIVENVKSENKKIIEADKVKNEFLANISHELRTPLNAIIGLSEVLNSKIFGELNEKQLEYVNDIYSSGVHLLNMINEILDISKLEAQVTKINYSTFGAETAISEVIRVMRPLADKKNIKINFANCAQAEIKSDYQKFQQIFYNLVGNAIKFTQNKGRIDITQEIKSGMLKISVKDNGIGIEKQFHDKIFDKFVQIETPYTKTGSSTGLGLTITKHFVEMLGGEISLKSAKGKGAEFICSFPLK